MNGWVIAALIEGLILLLTYSFLCLYGWNTWSNRRERKKEITERLDREGIHVSALVTDVYFSKWHLKYEVFAKWYGFETGQPYTFRKTSFSLLGAFGLYPNINEGDIVSVWVAFRPLIYLIEGKR